MKVYDRFLEARARGQGLNFRLDGAEPQRWAKVLKDKWLDGKIFDICGKIVGKNDYVLGKYGHIVRKPSNTYRICINLCVI